MVKAAHVEVIGKERAGSALITIKIKGDVASVRAAVDAGAAAAQRVGELVSSHVIPRPDADVEILIYPPNIQKKEAPKPKQEVHKVVAPIVTPPVAQVVVQEEVMQPAPRVVTPRKRPVAKVAPQASEQPAEVKSQPEVAQPLAADEESYVKELSGLSVHALRKYARTVSGLAIYGRQISRSNKDELIVELRKAKFPK